MKSRAPALSARARGAADPPISRLMHAALSRPELVSLAAGFVDQASLPVEATRGAIDGVLEDPACARAALQYGTTAGDLPLREQVLSRVLEQDAHDERVPVARCVPRPEQVVLTAGSNQLLYLLAESLLDPGDIVLCQAPTYFVYLGILRTLGARAVGVRCDDAGLCCDELEATLLRLADSGELARVKAIYVMSYFDNPRSLSLPRERRAELIDIARRFARAQPIYIIEDAAYRELRFGGDDAASLRAHDADGDIVAYTGTFSKAFAPGIRVGFGILPEALKQAVLDLKGNLDFGSPLFNQRIVSEALRRGLYEPHVAALRDVYARKLDAMVQALDTQLGQPGLARYNRPQGGLYVWASLPRGIDTSVGAGLFERALDEGVLYVPGAYCYPEPDAEARRTVRLSFGVQSEARIAEGVERLARALRRML